MGYPIGAITGYGIEPADGYIEAAINTYYLDTINGNDNSGDGSTGLPWQTLAKIFTVMGSGDTVILRTGNYGTYSQANVPTLTDWITFKADAGHAPVITTLSIHNTTIRDTYLRFDKIDFSFSTIANGIDLNFVRHLEIRGGHLSNYNHKYESGYCVRVQDSENVLIYENEIDTIRVGLGFTNATNITVSKNHVHGLAGSSGVYYGFGNGNTIIEKNNFHDSNFDTWDNDVNSPYDPALVSTWPHSSGISVRSNDLWVRGNIFHDIGSTSGIMTYTSAEPNFSNITIENNLFYDIQNSCIRFYNLGSNVVVKNNTVIGSERVDISSCVYKLKAALVVHSVGAASDGSGISVTNNIMAGSVTLPALAVTESNIMWSFTYLTPFAWLSTANDANTVISTSSGTDPSCPYTDFTTNFFTGIASLTDFTAQHGLIKDFTLDPLSDAVNFGDIATQSGVSLGIIDADGFIQGMPARSVSNHSAGAYEYPLSQIITETPTVALNQVQQDFINNAARPHMESMIRILHDLDTFIADYDALQASVDALATTTVVLDDAGASPRTDAPNLTGTDSQNMRNFSANMSLVVGAPAKQALIGKMVRNLNTVLKLN